MLTIGTTAMGVDDLARATTFWTEALGYVVEDSSDRSAALRSPDGTGATLYLHHSTTPVQEHPRVHLDLLAPDLATRTAEVERLQRLGATVADWDSYPDDPDFVVLADTEGNRFCVIDESHPGSPDA